MPRYEVFISHAHQQKGLAHLIKSRLSVYGVNAFVAHDDITPTVEWEAMILKVLRKCDVLLALLTRESDSSNWTDQETGIALALKKKIIPIKIDTNPHGFIARYQALSWKSDSPEISWNELVELLKEHEIIPTSPFMSEGQPIHVYDSLNPDDY